MNEFKIIIEIDGLKGIVKIEGKIERIKNRDFIFIRRKNIAKKLKLAFNENGIIASSNNWKDVWETMNTVDIYDLKTGIELCKYSTMESLSKSEIREYIIKNYYKDGIWSKSLSGHFWIDLDKFEKIN